MKYSILFINLAMLISACAKNDVDFNTYSANITVVNALTSFNTEIVTNVSQATGSYFNAKKIGPYSYDGKYPNGAVMYGLPVNKEVTVATVIYPDTLHPIFSEHLHAAPQATYSLFICGSPENPSAVLHEDTIPAQADSMIGIRIVNLSPNSGSLNIKALDSPEILDVQDLQYQQTSPFFSLPLPTNDFHYMLEVSDEQGNILSTYDVNNLIGKRNLTLIIRGLVDDTPGLEIARIDYY